MIKKRKPVFLIVLFALLVLIVAGGVVSRALILNRLKTQVRSVFQFSRMNLTLLPPALVLEEVKTRKPGVFFSAKRVSVTTGLLSLLAKTKPLTVILDQPVLRVSESDLKKLLSGDSKNPLPFTIDKAWIRLADITLGMPGASYHCWKANGLFRSRGQSFSLDAAVSDNVLTLTRSGRRYQGSLRLLLDGRGNSLRIRNLAVEGPSLALKAKGEVTKLADPEFDFHLVFNGETSLPLDLLDVPFRWTGKTRGEGTVRRAGRALTIDASLFSRDTTMTGFPLGEVTGRLQVKGPSGVLDLAVVRPAEPRSLVKILISPGLVRGILSRVPLDPVMKEIELPWPVQSPAWGEFTVRDGRLHVEAELKEDPGAAPQPDRFPFNGKAVVDWDGRTRVDIAGQKLTSSFGRAEVNGRLDIGTDLDLTIAGEFSDVKQARRFAELMLNTRFDLPPTEGRGSAEIRVFGLYGRPSVTSQFFLYPGGLGPLSASFVEGNVEIRPERSKGLFRVDDPQLMGTATILAQGGTLDADVTATRARMDYILPSLGIRLPLSGEGSGRVTLRSQSGTIRADGEFSAAALTFAGLPFSEVRGRLKLAGTSLECPELRLTWNGGEVQGRGGVEFDSRKYSLSLEAKDVELGPLGPGLRGRMSLSLGGQGVLGQDIASGRLEVAGPGWSHIQAESLGGDLSLNVLEDRLDLTLQGLIGTGADNFSVGFSLPFGRKPFALSLKGSIENLDILLPWPGAKGKLNFLAEIEGTDSSPRISGAVDVRGSVLPLPGFSQAFSDYSALAFIENRAVTLRSFQAKLGGGVVQGSGEIRLSGPAPSLLFNLEGKDMILIPWERTRALTDASLRLTGAAGRLALEGDLLVKRMSWRREISEPLAFSSTAFYRPRTAPGALDDLQLNLKIKANDDAWVENSLGRIRTRFDLSVTGTAGAPVVLGDIEALAGTVVFQDRSFNILAGKLSFFNPLSAEPYLDFKGEAYVKDYRVTFGLNGLVNHLRPEYSSSPPLPPEDVLALLAMGESFKRTYITDVSARLSSAALLADQLSDEAQKRASRLFNLDRISIDPFVMGSSTELVPRLTLGKKISRNLSIYYSTNLTTQREEIVRLEWELGRNFSLVGNRDELGTVSFDVKLRKRF